MSNLDTQLSAQYNCYSPPFALFPWNQPFLENVLEYINKQCQGDIGRSTIIMPHNRPQRYLLELLKKNNQGKPALLPRMFTLEEMRMLFLGKWQMQSVRQASMLDSVYLLYQAVKNIPQNDNIYDLSFANMDLATFLPWGIRLKNLFEEYMQQLLPVHDIEHMQGEVSEFAVSLLGVLGRIHHNYLELLHEYGWTTAALDAKNIAEYLHENPMDLPELIKPDHSQNKHVFILGFSTLTLAEDALLRSLWNAGAHICLHTDPNILNQNFKNQAHWSCQEHLTWINKWKAETIWAGDYYEHKPMMHFIAGYDVHSQLLALQSDLSSSGSDVAHKSTAIILTSPHLLLPTLHHLPEQNFNVSMGYPLEKSSLFNLIESLLTLQEGARGDIQVNKNLDTENTVHNNRRYHWRTLLHCLRHPFVQMLEVKALDTLAEEASFITVSLRSYVTVIEKNLRKGKRFVSLDDLINILRLDGYCDSELDLLQTIFQTIFQNFATVDSAWSLGEALNELCKMLLQGGEDFWQTYPLDAESLYRLMLHVIPSLTTSALAMEKLPQNTVFALCRQCISAERVPFEASPLQGLQVLGMLETRLLHFDKIYILDATDDALPGFSSQDPLLPDALRQSIGLPALLERERVVAYTLFRLLASAKQVHFYWQEGIQSSTLFDDKKIRSRFVDSFLWEEEQNLGHIIEHNIAPLRTLSSPVQAVLLQAQSITNSQNLHQKIQTLLTKGISPTQLDSYLRCPQRFIWENIYSIKPLDEVNEGDDPVAVGILLHKLLFEYYKEWMNDDFDLKDLDLEEMLELFNTLLKQSNLQHTLPPQSLILLQMAVPLRLENFINAQQEQITSGKIHTKALEKDLIASISGLNGEVFSILGRIDRVDRRWQHGGQSQGLVVLDYKTGRIQKNNPKAWHDMALWDSIAKWTPDADNSLEILDHVSSTFLSLQLACYIQICANHFDEPVLDAAFVELGSSGKEIYLFGDMPDSMDLINDRIPQLLSFVVNHLHTAKEFLPRQGDYCTYCPYGSLCHR